MANSISVKNSRRTKKIKLIIYKGGKCEICGYNKIDFPGCFVFHHIDPDTKDFNISDKNCSLEIAKNEVNKCMLLCCRCHVELHEKDYNLKRSIELKLKKKNVPKQILYCAFCQKEFFKHKSTSKFCSRKCFENYRNETLNNTDIKKLIAEAQNTSIIDVSRKYNISYSSLRRRIKKFKNSSVEQI